jgi:hypothetical protein
MVAMLIQLAITAMWCALLVGHTRRLFRLALAGVDSGTLDQHLRRRMHRMWWWLGREEFWGRVQNDTWYCLQITLMIFLLAWAS